MAASRRVNGRVLLRLIDGGMDMRRILAVGSAALLAFTVTTAPLSAADLGMPTKAPVVAAPVVEEVAWLPLALLGLLGLFVGLCAGEVICETHGGPTPTPLSPGASTFSG
jgi:hypothetical protein